MKMRCLLIGYGRRAAEGYMPALLSTDGVELCAVCDVDPARKADLDKTLKRRSSKSSPGFYTDLAHLLNSERPDFAIVATPHSTHLGIAEELLRKKIPFLKEKPFAMNLEDAKRLVALVGKHSGHMRLCVQRRHHPLYAYAKKAILQIGTVRHFTASYHLSAGRYYSGWRSRPETAGGGAVMDMGYHLVDLLYWYFGMPSQVYSVSAPKKNAGMDYSVEEAVLSALSYGNGTVGSVFLSMSEPDKHEELKVYGTKGYVHLGRNFLNRYDSDGKTAESLTREPAWPSEVSDVLVDFVENIDRQEIVAEECARGLDAMLMIQGIYESIKKKLPVSPGTLN